ncbi:HAD ATPase, P-type, IC family protein [Lysobacter capsici]|uniref:cation-translocating P-type ATPase n=1 Tax=Lysobacter capsici TaxID=435897 RepID=UPI000722498F|nr:cation-translocating P-type ATPase [Lysobacter capsici]ALN88623.1 HAD ATPase, P-type, IC family protein [Lysobacter capsici]
MHTLEPHIDAEVSPGPHGLTTAQALLRLHDDGPNLLPQPDRRNVLHVVLGVLREPMLLLLVAAAGIYLLLGDAREAVVLTASVALVVGLTFYQDYRSERALQALRDLSSPQARVLRDGDVRQIASSELVVGDVILVAEGDRVPADARLLDDGDLMLDESMLTGESVPVRRFAASASPTEPDLNVVRASTLVVRGHSKAQVVAVGDRTAVGQIGAALRALRPPRTPMQIEVRRAVAVFAVLGLGSSLIVTLLYVRLHGDWLQGALAGVTLAMANIPEEFPVVLTVFLALGSWHMARHKALVRRGTAIEALGSVTVLCTDKTGTLTANRMSVAELAANGERSESDADISPRLQTLLLCAAQACSEHSFDPMETAIGEAASRWSGTSPPMDWKRLREYPLSKDLLAVTHVWSSPQIPALHVACKGAPETIADLCRLPPGQRDAVLSAAQDMARRGLRVIAVASTAWRDGVASLPATPRGFDFAWGGLLGLADPLRDGVRDAVAEAQTAGIRVLMLTGDHLDTARAIATQAGLTRPDTAMLGRELEAADDTALSRHANAVDVFARVKPEHKLRLIEALKHDGQVVAMTGDGVNDAPALTAAHVGIAMGGRGTDVAREAASIVLLDDNFVTIVKAVRQGRVIYDNILRAIRYILAVHVPITGLAVLPLLFGAPLILMPLHVVFLELIIDPASTLVFEQEPGDADVMRRPPRSPATRLLDRSTLFVSLFQGAVVFATIAAIYAIGRGQALATGQLAALCFTALIAGNLGLIVANRSRTGHHWWRQSAPAFWIVVLSALAMLFVVTRLEAAAAWFRFAPAPMGASMIALLMPLLGLGLVEIGRSMRMPAWHRRGNALRERR